MPTKNVGTVSRAKSRKYSASPGGTPILFPKADSFFDIFDQVDSEKKTVAVMKSDYPGSKDKMGIGNWVMMSGGKSFHASPKKVVIEALEKTLIIVNYDTIYFEIVDRGGGNALVIAKYNHIIGSRWLAFIDPRTIPNYKPKR
jgi:hypothetical protein